MFTTVDSRVPANWVARIDELGVVEICPARWQVPMFWDSFYDRNPEAVRVFEEELAEIVR
ncbi:hypothetical protein GCM10022380_04980 [Amycolatopsis tucumanensis]|uniref:Uncharacterized protein n=1 Tax=Amycolatopsis tucumanensis TaxID=401106 RepID=A0ABP7HD71_9PSEU